MLGFVNVIKPEGESSAKVVSAVKKKFNCTAGHMGTLDPMASGILPIGLGKTSRLFQYLLDKEKEYKARFKFGESTDTLDTTGKIIKTCDKIPTEEEIKAVLPKFIGEIDQVPPKYSAKNIDGKRGYELARNGVEFELSPKKVVVLDIKITDKIADNEYEFTVKCKGGTYIRSLARDIGIATGSLAVMSKLDRVKCGIFDYNNGVKLVDLINSDNPEKYLINSEDAVNFEKLKLDKRQEKEILNGIYNDYGFKDGIYRVYGESGFIGIGEANFGVLKIKSYVKEV